MSQINESEIQNKFHNKRIRFDDKVHQIEGWCTACLIDDDKFIIAIWADTWSPELEISLNVAPWIRFDHELDESLNEWLNYFSEVETFTNISFPEIKKVYPIISTEEFCTIQPMIK